MDGYAAGYTKISIHMLFTNCFLFVHQLLSLIHIFSQFPDTKASVLGEYVPAKLGFEEEERLVGMALTKDYSGNILFCFENGKVAKVPIKSYETKTNRKKLANAYSDKSPRATAL